MQPLPGFKASHLRVAFLIAACACFIKVSDRNPSKTQKVPAQAALIFDAPMIYWMAARPYAASSATP
jgi:hypothetical protein